MIAGVDAGEAVDGWASGRKALVTRIDYPGAFELLGVV